MAAAGMIRVLLADDQALIRMGFRMVLDAEADIEVVGEAADGAAAITQAKALNPDVVLMDIRMPKVDGLAATMKIRQSKKSYAATIPIIAMTSNAFDDDILESKNAGMNAHLTKPIEPEVLFSTLQMYLR